MESVHLGRVKLFTKQIPNNVAYYDIAHNKGSNRKLESNNSKQFSLQSLWFESL
jgi:hypothetical protein